MPEWKVKNTTILVKTLIMPDRDNTQKNDLSPALSELTHLLDAVAPADGVHHLTPFAWVFRASGPTHPAHTIYTPVLCVMAQGRKQVLMGEDRFIYDTAHFFLASFTVPAACQVLDATPEHPCLSLAVALEPETVASVIAEARLPPLKSSPPQRAMEASRIDAPLLDAAVRLARGFEAPRDAAFLAPLALREIIYRLLCGGQGARLRQIAAQNGEVARVARALQWLRAHYDQPLSIPALARHCGMRASALHQQFKAVTAMTPLQYQKQMRLQEARRLMSSEGLDAARAGFEVGYGDPSYFSRDYKRFFGEPPRQHAARLHSEVW